MEYRFESESLNPRMPTLSTKVSTLSFPSPIPEVHIYVREGNLTISVLACPGMQSCTANVHSAIPVEAVIAGFVPVGSVRE